jgi:hypothetical protein
MGARFILRHMDAMGSKLNAHGWDQWMDPGVEAKNASGVERSLHVSGQTSTEVPVGKDRTFVSRRYQTDAGVRVDEQYTIGKSFSKGVKNALARAPIKKGEKTPREGDIVSVSRVNGRQIGLAIRRANGGSLEDIVRIGDTITYW